MQLKYYFHYFLTIWLVLGITGCDYLDTRIETGIKQEDLDSDYTSLSSLGYAPYTYLRNGFYAIDNNIMAAVTDEAKQTAPTSNAQYYNNGSWDAFRNPLDVYSYNYSGIRTANFFLEYSADYKSKLAVNRDTISNGSRAYWQDVENIEWMRAESHILIAWFYFDLIKRYGGVPLVTKVLTINDNTDLPRTDFDEVVAYIVSKIDEHQGKMQANWKARDVARDGRLTMGMALALKSRVLLYAASPLHNGNNNLKKWEEAAKAANDVIQLKARTYNANTDLTTITDLPAYTLANDYRQLFLESNSTQNNEIIWSHRTGATNDMERRNYPIGTPGGNSGVTPSHNLVSAYEYTGDPDADNPYTNRDPRLAYSIAVNNSSWNGRTIEIWQGGRDSHDNLNASRTGYYLKKFLIENLYLQQDETRIHNWVVFRFAEILLNYAEAMNEAYGPDSDPLGYGMTARDAVNMVRSRTGVAMSAVVANQQSEMRTKIKHERRIELAFEDHRYWDLIRWKDGEELNKPLMGIKAERINASIFSYTEFTVENRFFSVPKMYYFPILDSEIKKSKGILEQNPDW